MFEIIVISLIWMYMSEIILTFNFHYSCSTINKCMFHYFLIQVRQGREWKLLSLVCPFFRNRKGFNCVCYDCVKASFTVRMLLHIRVTGPRSYFYFLLTRCLSILKSFDISSLMAFYHSLCPTLNSDFRYQRNQRKESFGWSWRETKEVKMVSKFLKSLI